MGKALFIGTSGWSYPEWKGILYPKGVKQSEFLSFYATRFNCVEINASFYYVPQTKTVENWVRLTPPEFRFAVKMHRGITHYARLKNVDAQLRDFYARMEPMRSRCGAVLIQLPPSLVFSEPVLLDFLRSLEPYRDFAPVVLEPRHESWYVLAVNEILNEAGVSIVWHDYKGTEVIWEFQTGDIIYLRLHGWPELFVSPYSDIQLQEVAARLKPFVGQKDIWVFFNNTAAGHAIANAEYLWQLLEGGKG